MPSSALTSSRFRHCVAADGAGQLPDAARRRRVAVVLVLVAAWSLAGRVASAQQFSYRGYADGAVLFYPRTTPIDATQTIGDAILRVDPSLSFSRTLLIAASFDARMDTHHQTARTWDVSFSDRGIQRPALAVRRLSAVFSTGPVTLEVGKQFVRWGKTDMMSPSDRFAPRDYLTVIDNDVLAVTAARLTVAGATDSLEFVYSPRFTPSRAPLLTQRWAPNDIATAPLPIVDQGSTFPKKAQIGARWNHTGQRAEYSVSFFDGYDHQPQVEGGLGPTGQTIDIRRRYAALRTYGADLVVPLSSVAFRAELAAFDAPDADANEYVLYVLQGERQWREWLFIAGYSGEKMTNDRNIAAFSADRGLAGALLVRASYNLGGDRSFIIEAIARHNGDGVYSKAEYSRIAARNLRVALRFVAISGKVTDFLGQYRLNSFTAGHIRYNF